MGRLIEPNYQRQYVTYSAYDGSVDGSVGNGKLLDAIVDQHEDPNLYTDQWLPIASNVSFPSGTGILRFEETLNASDSQYGTATGYYYYQLTADAVKFEPVSPVVINIMRRHYYVRIGTTTYLVNITNGAGAAIDYYRVLLNDPDSNREVVTANKLQKLVSPADDAEIAALDAMRNNRSYTEEVQNFSNWYSFYRRRELTAKNAIANAIQGMEGVYIGLIFINNYRGKDTAVKPVRVNLNEILYDESADLLDILYNYQYAGYGTPLRNGLKKAGRYFKGDYLVPGTLPTQTNSASYPYFTEDKGGSCQMAFTVIFSDGYYNGTDPAVGNADGDNNTIYDGAPFADSTYNTLADVAMYYYESDLNTSLPNNVGTSTIDTANHQHMVTYTLAFGVTGSLDTTLFEDCPLGTCPSSWPSTGSDVGKIDDMFHAAVNGRGEYMSASSSTELNEALQVLKENIKKRLGSGAGLASSSIQRTSGTKIFQGTYYTANWYGEITALPLDATSGAVQNALWNASDHVPAWGSRNVFSYNGGGIVFDAGNLSATQISTLEASGLGTAEQIVNFIKGDTSNDVAHSATGTGKLRNRAHPIGDIVHSAPTYFQNTVYIGSNDGMLHAVNANTGEERFTYVPGLVYDHLADLADPSYSHKYYVDGTPTVVNAGGQYLLVCGLGKGGKGYFALDVTAPENMTAGDVLWEFTDGNDMGYSYSRPSILKTASDGYVVIVGNGYDSTNGEAILYVLNAATGNVLRKIHTGATGCNGLSEPAVVDVQFDGYPDYAFAGDLKGNIWKFDLRGDVADWDVYYQDGSIPQPLVTVANTSGNVQAITEAPNVMLDCAGLEIGRGLMVLFGTGQYLTTDDLSDTAQQSFYGIWDWGKVWEEAVDLATARGKFLGTLNSDRSLSSLGTGVGLLEQVVESETTDWYSVSNNSITWYLPSEWGLSGSGTHMGWVFDLPDSGERVIQTPKLQSGVMIGISTIPSSSPCDAGGSSVIWALNACTGGGTFQPFFDYDDDGDIDEDDTISGEPPTGKKIPKIFIPDILLLDPGKMYYADPDNPDGPPVEEEDAWTDPIGMFYWRMLEQ